MVMVDGEKGCKGKEITGYFQAYKITEAAFDIMYQKRFFVY